MNPSTHTLFRRAWRTRATIRRPAQHVALGIVVILAMATPVQADSGLTGAVAASYFPRTDDGTLHSIAHQRVLEISACSTCLNHTLMRAGTSEVVAYNFGSADPIGEAVRQWRSSALHDSILSNASLGRIGCAQANVGSTSYFACVLAPGALPAPAPAPAAPVAAALAPASGGQAPAGGGAAPAGGGAVAGLLPDTSTPTAVGLGGAWHAFT